MGTFAEICMKIQKVEIQGAENVAKAAVKALLIKSDARSVKQLLSLRPTEPCMRNAVNFAKSDPKKFTPDQIWILIRAIKVQSQILQLYIGETALDV